MGFESLLGVTDWPGRPPEKAPARLLRVPGVGFPVTLFLQGIMLDSASLDGRAAVTNGVLVVVK